MYRAKPNSLRAVAPTTFWLVVANVVVYLLTLFVSDLGALYERWGLAPARFVEHFGAAELLTVLSSMFLHGGLLHLLANVIFLWVFGRMVEQRLDSRRFAWLYALSGVAAVLAHVIVDPQSIIPLVGASGAISGVLAAAVVLAGRERIIMITPLTLFIPISMSVLTFGYVWVGLQLVGLLAGDLFGLPVAYLAHLGGFLAGLAVARAVRHPRPRARRPDPIRRGPAPGPGFRSFSITDSQGRTFVFHEPV